MSEVSDSLQSGMLLFSCGPQQKTLNNLHTQSLDDQLSRSPKHPPNYTLKKEFNGEGLRISQVPVYLIVKDLLPHLLQVFSCQSKCCQSSLPFTQKTRQKHTHKLSTHLNTHCWRLRYIYTLIIVLLFVLVYNLW